MNNASRDLISRQSTQSTFGGGAMLSPNCGSCLEPIHELYQKLEPQISKSYRPHVKYEPPPPPDPNTVKPPERTIPEKQKKGKNLKSVQIMLGAVSEMQKRRDSNGSVKKKFSDMARRVSQPELSQSLPNLTNSES